jgi:hypothetical protein
MAPQLLQPDNSSVGTGVQEALIVTQTPTDDIGSGDSNSTPAVSAIRGQGPISPATCGSSGKVRRPLVSPVVRSSPFGCGPSTDERGSGPNKLRVLKRSGCESAGCQPSPGARPPPLPGWLGAQGRGRPSPLRDDEVAEVVVMDPPVGRIPRNHARVAHTGNLIVRTRAPSTLKPTMRVPCK